MSTQSIKSSQQLKQLQSRAAKLESEIKFLKQEMEEKQGDYHKARLQLKGIKYEIEQLKDKDIVVSEHAMLRYLERAMGLNLDDIKQAILTEETKAYVVKLGNGKYPIGNGLRVVVKDNVVVSVVD